jgi:hypothetical protein
MASGRLPRRAPSSGCRLPSGTSPRMQVRLPECRCGLTAGYRIKTQITRNRVTTQIPPPGTLAVASTTDCEA